MTPTSGAIFFSLTLCLPGLVAQVAEPPAHPPAVKRVGPGYYGGWPSAVGKQVVEQLVGGQFTDKAGRFGGGRWQIEQGAIVPHPLGPGRCDVIEMRNVGTKGPHVILRRDAYGFFLPTRCDGDVLALLALLGLPTDERLQPGPVSEEWQEAIGLSEGFGAEQKGLRLGVVAGEEGLVKMRLWNVSKQRIVLEGRTSLVVEQVSLEGPAPLPSEYNDYVRWLVLLWPPTIKSSEGRSYIRLAPGQIYEKSVRLGPLTVPGFRVTPSKKEFESVAMRDLWVGAKIESVVAGVWTGPPDLRPVTLDKPLFSAGFKMRVSTLGLVRGR